MEAGAIHSTQPTATQGGCGVKHRATSRDGAGGGGFRWPRGMAKARAGEGGKRAEDDGGSDTFVIDGVRAARAGEWFRNPDYARTLRLIAKGGPAVFYGGALGQRLVTRVHALKGFLTLDDLRKQQAVWVTPISAMFHGYRVWELPPNGQGVATLEMLRILEPYDLESMGQGSALYLHHLIEAKKLAYADIRRFVGDTLRDETPAHLLSDAFIAERRGKLDATRAAVRPDPGPEFTASETIYPTAADAHGNMVSFITSLFDAFFSHLLVPRSAFALLIRASAFSL